MTVTLLDHPNVTELPRRLTDVTAWHGLIPVAFSVVAMHKPRLLVELGTHKGDSYCAFCQAVASLGLETACYAIDTWRGDGHAGRYDPSVLEELRAHHDPLYGHFSRLVPSTFDEALSLFSDRSIDLLHIDGYHTYEAVKHDFESWLPKMSARGIVLLHDTDVHERGFGVWRFFDELKQRYPTIEFKFSHGLGMVAVGEELEASSRSLFELSTREWQGLEAHFRALGNRVQLAGEVKGLRRRVAHLEQECARLRGELCHRESKGQNSQNASDQASGTDDKYIRAYHTWIAKRTLQEIDGQLFAERMILKWRTRPVFHLVMYLGKGEESLLADTLDALGGQLYQEWRLTVIADFPAPDSVFHELPVLKWFHARAEDDLVQIFNDAATASDAGWIGFFEPGVRFEPHFLIACGDYINLHPEWRLIYTDEDLITASGERRDPKFKPDFNLDMLRSTNYIGNFLVHRDAFLAAGGYSDLAGAQNYDLILRVLDHDGEGAIGHIADVLYHIPAQGYRQSDYENEREALRRHLQRNRVRARVEPGYLPSSHRVAYEHDSAPLVSIIVPTKDRPELIKPCIESLLQKTAYPRYEVLIIDNQSTDPDALEYYEDLQKREPDRIRVLEYPYPFNFSAICNFGAKEAKGDYLLLLNNDTQIIQQEWLERMMIHGQRPEVGIVGARLVYPETGKLQHAGVIVGLTGIADHPFNDVIGLNEPGYMGRAQIDQNYSAVTAACMLIKKSVYHAAGGMDEEKLKVLFNDVDLCLRVGQKGYKIVWTPYAVVVHHGSRSITAGNTDPIKLIQGLERAKRERETMMERWLPVMGRDPAYNPHLSLVHTDFRVESTAVIDWDVNFHDRPRALGMPLPGGSGHYRVVAPFQSLSRAGLAQCNFIQPQKYFETRILTPAEVERASPDVLLHHAAILDSQLEALEIYRRFNRVSQIFTLDDLVTQVPEKSPFYKRYYRDGRARLRRALASCERMIVTTEPLKELARGMIDDIRVIPNYLEKTRWLGLTSLRRQGQKPRVGWAGAQQHHGDLAVITEVVKATADEVDWIFFGMCLEELIPYAKEVHDFVISYEEYPAKLASLNLDLAVAPLELHPFNEAKSNLRLLEYGILGWPVVASDILPYQNAPVKRVPNDPQAWIEAIRERTHDLDAAAAEGAELKSWVERHCLLEDHLDEWYSALFAH